MRCRAWLVFAMGMFCSTAWSSSMVRIACEGDSARAEVSINGQFKGECPMDVEVKPGEVKLRAVKPQSVEVERIFEDGFRIGDGVMKRVEIQLGRPQYTAEGMRRLQARKQAEEEAARKAKLLAEEAARREAAEKERLRLEKLAQAEEARKQAQARLAASLQALKQQGVEPGNGKAFRDCAECPVMVMIPPRAGLQSAPVNEPVAMGQYEITRGEFARYIRETGRKAGQGCFAWHNKRQSTVLAPATLKHELNWENPGFEQADDHPVVCLDLASIRDYLRWLSEKSGYTYRLPPIDWWYVAAGYPSIPANPGQTPAPLPWGNKPDEACKHANVLDTAGDDALSTGFSRLLVWRHDPFDCNDSHAYTAPVGKFTAGTFGLHDMFGNVSEWVDPPGNTAVNPLHLKALGIGLGWQSGPLVAGLLSEANFMAPMNISMQPANYIGFRVMRYVTPQ